MPVYGNLAVFLSFVILCEKIMTNIFSANFAELGQSKKGPTWKTLPWDLKFVQPSKDSQFITYN